MDRLKISDFGLGTWGIGGFATKNEDNNDAKQVEAMVYALQHGVNYASTSLWYSQGRTAELLKEAITSSSVSDVFLTQSIYVQSAPTVELAIQEVEEYRKLMQRDMVDSIQIQGFAFDFYKIDGVFRFLEHVLREKMAASVSLTNHSLEQLQHVYERFGEKVFGQEIGYNLEIREYEKNGAIAYANEHSIQSVVYQPLRRNRTSKRNWPLLLELAKKYNKSQNQVLLNWLKCKNMIPLIKSESIEHIKENLDSISFQLSKDDVFLLDAFVPPGYIAPLVSYQYEGGEGVRIDQLSNAFDEAYDA